MHYYAPVQASPTVRIWERERRNYRHQGANQTYSRSSSCVVRNVCQYVQVRLHQIYCQIPPQLVLCQEYYWETDFINSLDQVWLNLQTDSALLNLNQCRSQTNLENDFYLLDDLYFVAQNSMSSACRDFSWSCHCWVSTKRISFTPNVTEILWTSCIVRKILWLKVIHMHSFEERPHFLVFLFMRSNMNCKLRF